MMTNPAEIFEQYRPLLFHLAYGMLGRVTQAEDAVQEAYIRWQKQDTGQIRSPKAWLSKVVNRICLDEIKSAKNRREEYIGPYLPEPVLEAETLSPEDELELAESISMALFVVLDELTPVERAVFLLREVFDYEYADIAGIINKSEQNCRKIAQRSREKVHENRPGFERNRDDQYKLVNSFIDAVKEGDLTEIESMLAEEAILYSDGGGKVLAARKPIVSAANIARFLAGIQKKNGSKGNWRIEFRDINGETGMIMWLDNQIYNTWAFHIEKGKIQSIYVVLNPEKLRHLNERMNVM